MNPPHPVHPVNPVHSFPCPHLRISALLVLLCVLPHLLLAWGEEYVGAYNGLARMINARGQAIDSSWPTFAEKALSDDVSQSDLNALRQKTIFLLQACTVDPADYDLTHQSVTEAFPPGLQWDAGGSLVEPSLMTGIGHNGYFTRVPAEYRDTGTGLFANDFTDVPLLWIHFTEICEALKRVRYLRMPDSEVSWTNQGEANLKYATHSGETDWPATVAIVDAAYDSSDTAIDFPPHAYCTAKRIGAGEDPMFYALKSRSYAYCQAGTAPPLAPMRCQFFACAVPWGTFDSFGAPALDRQWKLWDTVDRGQQTTVTSDPIAVDAHPQFPGEPTEPDLLVGWGFDLNPDSGGQVAVIYELLDLPEESLHRPVTDDIDDDGLVATGCDCDECLPDADIDWRDDELCPYVAFMYGKSSGAETGGLRVKSYLSEYMLGDEVRQMHSLDTRAYVNGDGSEGYMFVSVKRPTGRVVLFSLYGSSAGTPLNANTNYRLAQTGGGYELRFPDEHCTVHLFSASGGIAGVRRTMGSQTVTVTGNSDQWPGLAVGRDWLYRIGLVTSPGMATYPCYETPTANALVNRVAYLDTKGGWNEVWAVPGSRVYRQTDKQGGTTLSETRLIVDTNRVELRRGVALDGSDLAMLEESRTRAYDEASDTTTLTHIRTLNPDLPNEQQHTVQTEVRHFPFGNRITRETVDPDGADPRATVYAYHTDAGDTNAYGRVQLVERSDGSWTRYDAYSSNAQPRIVCESFLDSPPDTPAAACRSLRYVYAGDPGLAGLAFPMDDQAAAYDTRPRLEIESVLGFEVRRAYTAYLSNRWVTVNCAQPGAVFDAPDNLLTVTYPVGSGDYAGRPALIEHAGGTVSRYTYLYNSSQDQLTITRRDGQGNAGAVTNGTEMTSVFDGNERLISRTVSDIETGIVIESTETTRDGLGRVLQTEDMLTGALSEQEYGCCERERTVDADGIETLFVHDALGRVTESTRLGVTNAFTHNVLGSTVRTEQRSGGTTAMSSAAYDAHGRVVAQTNALGDVTSRTYVTATGGGEAVTTVHPDGGTETDTYYRDGRLRSRTGTAAVPRCYTYGADADGPYSTEYFGDSDTAAQWIRTHYDLLGRVCRVVHADGYTISNEYDAAGRLVEQNDGLTRTLARHDSLGRKLLGAIDMNGNGQIDAAGTDRMQEVVQTYGMWQGKPARIETTRLWPDNHIDAVVTQRVRYASLDEEDLWTIEWGRTNHLQVVRDRAARSRTETVTRPDGTQLVSTFQDGRLVAVVERDSGGGTVREETYTHDASGRVLHHQAPSPAEAGSHIGVTYAHDLMGQVTNVTVAAGALVRSTGYVYDAMGRRVRTVFPDGGIVTNAYSLSGELVQQHGARTVPVTYGYDVQGRLTSLATYRSGLSGTADVTGWDYDPARGRVTAKVYGDGSRVQHSYRADGLPAERTWARGVETTYTYDAGGRVASVSYSDGTPAIVYERDRQGRITGVTDGAGQHTLTYTPDGNPAGCSNSLAAASLDYTYDAPGRRSRLSFLSQSGSPDPIEENLDYAYDPAGRLASITGDDLTHTYSYGADGRTVTGRTVRVEGVVAFTAMKRFDALGRVAAVENRGGPAGPVLSSAEYGFDSAGRRVERVGHDGAVWSYAYDALGQLVSGEKRFADGTPVYGACFAYGYDTAGNRVSACNRLGALAGTCTYSANGLNQYGTIDEPGQAWITGMADPAAEVLVDAEGDGLPALANRHGDYFWRLEEIDNAAGLRHLSNVTIVARMEQVDAGVTSSVTRTESRTLTVPPATRPLAYDADGNLLTDGLWQYTWNGENRLVAIESDPAVPPPARVKCEYVYDYRGRRAQRVVSEWSSAGSAYVPVTTNTYLYDGWNVVCETIRLPTSDFRLLNTWGLDISGTPDAAAGIGGLLGVTSVTSSGGTTLVSSVLPAYDANGNITILIDTNGEVVAEYDYDPFGNLVAAEETTGHAGTFGFSTKPTYNRTGLIYYGHRWYSSTLGRWLSLIFCNGTSPGSTRKLVFDYT